MRPSAFVVSIVLMLFVVVPRAYSVVVPEGSGRNTSAPTGTLAGSGWQYEGQWGSFLGTPISAHDFITAQHVGGSVGSTFVYQGVSYTTTAFYDSSTSDLRVWQVGQTFPTFAPLYTGGSEQGMQVVIFGRGTQRGDPIISNGQPIGWGWGASDGVESWGTTTANGWYSSGMPWLSFKFTNTPGASASITSGDSGGGVFINNNGVWQLDGVNYGYDGQYSFTGTTGSGFNGSLYNLNGMYLGSDGNWSPQSAGAATMSYASRISSANVINWLNAIPNVSTDSQGSGGGNAPEPATATLLYAGGLMLLARRRR